MAGALRPAVLFILLASVLFVVDGYLDGVYPGGAHGSLESYSGLGWTSYLFAVANAIVAIAIARGSERMLALRIGLAAFFIFERPVSAVALGVKPIESIAVHGLTALVEAMILASTMRVWRLGHSFSDADMSLLALSATPEPAVAAAGASGSASYAVGVEAIPAAAAPAKAPMAVKVRRPSRVPGWLAWTLRWVVLVAFIPAFPIAIVWGFLMYRQYKRERGLRAPQA